MPNISLETFRAAVRSNNQAGFVELSRNQSNVKKYGNSFFGRVFGWFANRSAEVNRRIRFEFCRALSEPGKCQADVLERLQRNLNFDAQGNDISSRPLSVREVKAMLAEAEASKRNSAARQSFFGVMEQTGFLEIPSVRATALSLLGLPNGEDQSKELTPELRQSIQDQVIQAAREAVCGTNDVEEFLREVNLSVPRDVAKFRELFQSPKRMSDLRCCAAFLNNARINGLEIEWTKRLADTLVELSDQSGYDFSSSMHGLDKLTTLVVRDMTSSTTNAKAESPEELTQLFEARLAKFVGQKKEMLDILARQGKTLPEGTKRVIGDCIAQYPAFRQPRVLEAILKNLTIYDESYSLLGRDVKMSDFMGAYERNTKAVSDFLNQLARTENDGVILGGEDSDLFATVLKRITKQDYMERHQMTELPAPSDSLKDCAATFARHALTLKAMKPESTSASTSKFVRTGDTFENRIFNELQTVGQFCDSINLVLPDDIETGVDFDNPPTEMPELDPSEIHYLNHVLGMGIQRNELDGTEFSQAFSGLFQEKFIENLESTLQKAQKGTEDNPRENWFQLAKDLARISTSMTLGGESVIRGFDATASDHESLYKFCDKMGAYFHADQQNGVVAERFFGDFVHQGFFAILQTTMMTAGDPVNGMFLEIPCFPQDFSLSRNEDGSYDLDFKGQMYANMYMGDVLNPETGKMESTECLLEGSSHVAFDFKLKLSFDPENGASIAFREPPMISGALKKADPALTQQSFKKVLGLKEQTEDGTLVGKLPVVCMHAPEVYSDETFLSLMKARKSEEIVKFLESHAMMETQKRTLEFIGVPTGLQLLLLYRNNGPDVITRSLMDKLESKTPQERSSALQEIQEKVDRCKTDKFTDRTCVLSTKYLPLLRESGLSYKGSRFSGSDVYLTMQYLKNHSMGDDILEALESDDEARKAQAREDLKPICLKAREEGYDEMLGGQHNFTEKQVEALRQADKETVEPLIRQIAYHEPGENEAVDTLKKMVARI